MKKFIMAIFLILALCSISFAKSDRSLVVNIDTEINNATSNFVSQAIKYASDNDFKNIIFKIDTYGGRIDSAKKISKSILATNLNTIAFIDDKAESAGVLISISADKVYMSKSATIGSAEPIPNTEKTLSFWRSALASVAKLKNRDENIILAMADKDIEIDRVVNKGKLLNLDAKLAKELNISDGTLNSINKIEDITNSKSTTYKPNMEIKFARLISSSHFITYILIIAVVGLVVEIMTPGFGVGGTLSLIAFTLFFLGNIFAGNSKAYSILIFLVGILLIAIEIFVPGFGLPGISGIICIAAGIIFAIGNLQLALFSFTSAILISLLVAFILYKSGYRSSFLKKIELIASATTEKGYVSNDLVDLNLGDMGTSITVLRPTGYASFNEKKYQVISNKAMITADKRIKIVRISGSNIFVEEV